MDRLSPEYWTGTDYVPPGDTSRSRRDSERKAVAPAWLPALPHPAALVECRDGKIRFEYWNDQFDRCFGALARGEREQDPARFERFETELNGFATSGHDVSRFELERLTTLGTEVFDCTLAWVHHPEPGKSRVLITAIDRTANRRIEESLRRELVSDALTALPNRIGFGESVEAILEWHATPGEAQIGVLIVDLLRFSRINEALGTMAGDELILSVAARLKACVGDDVSLSRTSGNEFGICHIFTNGVTEVMDMANRIKAAIAAPIRLSNLQISIDCAVGCALVPISEAEPDELIRQAQTAARTAKKTDRLEIYRAGELGAARQRFFLESHLRDTLQKGGLHLQYQPITDLTSGIVIGFEALARWDHPVLGPISPNDFIPVAEESGLVVQLGRWALHEAMRQLRRWDEKLGETVPIKINVNLSPTQMARDDVLGMINDALRLSGVGGERLMIELTESAVVGDPDNCGRLLDALKRSNVAVAMDDFGTGYSNMASLQSLPIDLLKIDRSFVTNMMKDQDKLAIVRAILSLAAALGMRTTAEGIESADVAAKLRDMGCCFGQGYHFARPMSADEAYAYWLERRYDSTRLTTYL